MDIIALTFGDVAPEVRHRLLARAHVALQRRSHGTPPDVFVERDDLVVLGREIVAPDLSVPVPLVRGPVAQAAPWAELTVTDNGCEVQVDDIGYKHVSIYQGTGWAGASTSSSALGAVTDEPLDRDAWAAMALVGNLLVDRTAVRGVRRLRGGEAVTLGRGVADVVHRPATDMTEYDDITIAEAVTLAVTEALDAAPGATIELSGGLDSRVILAAMSPAMRRGRRAVTVGSEADVDVVIARRIAEHEQLDQHVIVSSLTSAGGEEIWRTIQDASMDRDFAVPALAAGNAQHVQGRLGAQPQFNGSAGGFAKAFYAAGIPVDMDVSRRSVQWLVRLRMIANHRIPDGVMTADWMARGEDAVIEDVHAAFVATDLPMRAASDEFYLYDRIANWGGAAYSRAAANRPVLTPLLHPAFIAAVRSLPDELRLDSRAYAAAIASLDPWLGNTPLDSGVTPFDLAGGMGRWRLATRRWRKAAGKVHQKLTEGRRPPAGLPALVGPVGAALATHDVASDVADLGWFSPAFLETAASSATDVDSLSLLVNIAGVSRFLREVRLEADLVGVPSSQPTEAEPVI